jgi:hypothetical protein
MPRRQYQDCVFLNVPFDRRYEPFLRALVFTVHDCGLIARCAREVDDSGQVRAEKIYQLIADCQLGIHDLSRTTLDRVHRLPRFNMPLELGIFLGAARLGTSRHKKKACLVLDRDRYRYQKFCSDIAGQDIGAHHNRVDELIASVRDWLSNQLVPRKIQVPGHGTMAARYRAFQRALPAASAEFQLEPNELTYSEYTKLAVAWLDDNRWTLPGSARGAASGKAAS